MLQAHKMSFLVYKKVHGIVWNSSGLGYISGFLL